LTCAGSRDSRSETLLAVRNALTLGSSLLLTWTVAIGMRLVLPRYLGPERFGTLSFVDAFTATLFVALGLGMDVYVRKEVSVRTSHASDFVGGGVLLRAILSVLLFGAMTVFLRVSERPVEVRRLAYIFAASQFFVVTNQTLSALLHATGRVTGMSMLSVASKLAWAAGSLIAIACGAGLWAFAAALLASEVLRTVVLYALVRRHLSLRFHVDLAGTKAMLLYSLPYFVNALAIAAYGRLDLTLLELRASNREVGWYAGASAIAGLTLLATPIIEWVLTPMFARAAARSPDELYIRVRRALEVILALAIPASLFVCVGADAWVRILFGEAFVPAVPALRIRAAMFVLTYVAIVYALTLTMLERPWALACISLAGLTSNVSLNVLAIPRGLTAFGEGGGGIACAAVMVVTEVLVTGAMIAMVGRRAFDRRTAATVVTSLAGCAAVVVVDRLVAQHGGGLNRLLVDVPTYLVVVFTFGRSRTREAAGLVGSAMRQRMGVAGEE
jgi:O-antigen/teichoic acid export membrane protein